MAKGTSVDDLVLASVDGLQAEDLPDGGQGSIRLLNQFQSPQRFGRQVAEYLYRDTDGMAVSIALNLDKDGHLFELDFFKGDSSPLLKYPNPLEIEPAIDINHLATPGSRKKPSSQ
jgi:hypothetical protein